MAKKKKSKKKARRTTAKKSGGAQIRAELSKLAGAVEKALQAAAGSRHIGGVRSDVKSSVNRIGKRLQSAIADARKSEQTRALRSQARRVVSAGRKQAQAQANRLKGDLSKGIKTLASELGKLAKKVEKS